MKHKELTQTFVVLSQEAGTSQVTGKPYTKIVLIGTKDRNEYVTYVDEANHNHNNWNHITANPQHGFVLRNLKTKIHKEKLLVNADSKPIIAAEDETQERILETLYDVWKEQDEREKNQFKELFE